MEIATGHRSSDALEAGLAHVRQAPADGGRVELIVCRPAVDERVVLDECALDATDGLVGDNWRPRGNSRTPDGAADPKAQLTVMNARAAALLAGAREAWPVAGDQLYVDLDLSSANLPPGSRLALGSAVIEVSDKPHRGCAKFAARFGREALQVVNSPEGVALNLRGINAVVVVPGIVRVGDRACKLPVSTD